MMKTVYNVFRIPYYYALISRHGEVMTKAIIPVKKTRKYFRVKGIKAVFILPKDTDVNLTPTGPKIGIPPLRLKSGRLVVYDRDSVHPMRLVTKTDDVIEYFKEEIIEDAVLPQQYMLTPLDVNELHDFIESKVVEDIMSGEKREIPMWVLLLIAGAIAGAVILGSIWMITNAGVPAPVVLPAVTPTPTPTLGFPV